MTQAVQIQEYSRLDLEAAAGLVGRSGSLLQPDIKFGFNAVVSTSAEAVHSLGGLINFPTAAETVRIKAGGNAADTAAGDGARSVTVVGIDVNLQLVEETLATAGASASAPTTALFWRIFRTFVVDVGLAGVGNTAAIVIENTTATQELINIPIGAGQSQSSLISTPIKRPIVITGLTLEVEAALVVEFKLYVRENFNVVAAPFPARRLRLAPVKVPGGIWPVPFDAPIFVPALSDVWLEAVVPTTDAEAGSLMSYYTVPTR